ncbi:hypothetical protein K461DRAFT_272621, partial [Myriangium duriaei CBS 260.36]
MLVRIAWRRTSGTPALTCSSYSSTGLPGFAFTNPPRSSYSIKSSRGRASKQLLPDGPARTRFAPSPTGHLHLGSLRTALFNFLLAKKTAGQFILRIEDTDRKRTVTGAQQRLCQDLKWAGLIWDEGPDVGGPHGPYNQSQRTELYQKHAQKLLQSGVAYRCFCPAESSAVEAADPATLASRIGGCQSDCKHLSEDQASERLDQGVPFVVRFSFRGPPPPWTDLVYGTMGQNKVTEGRSISTSIADTILLKSDGTPTYHLANVIDDHTMEITHVIRGTEWMSSTGLHVALYNGFGWQPPAFAHVGLLTDEAGNKLSKRNFDTDVMSLTKRHGLLPEALGNFLALMGWSNPEKSDVRDLKELVDLFDLKFTKGNSVVSLDKLWYLQRQHARRKAEKVKQDPESVRGLDDIVQYLAKDERTLNLQSQIASILGVRSREDYLRCIVLADAGNYESSSSFLDNSNFYLKTYGSDPTTLHARESESPQQQHSIEKIVAEFMNDAETVEDLRLWDKADNARSERLFTVMSGANSSLSKRLTEICLKEARRMSDVTLDDASVKKTTEYKALSKQLHDYLRTKLTFTSDPGPASVMIMVVLGYEEARRRLLGSN